MVIDYKKGLEGTLYFRNLVEIPSIDSLFKLDVYVQRGGEKAECEEGEEQVEEELRTRDPLIVKTPSIRVKFGINYNYDSYTLSFEDEDIDREVGEFVKFVNLVDSNIEGLLPEIVDKFFSFDEPYKFQYNKSYNQERGFPIKLTTKKTTNSKAIQTLMHNCHHEKITNFQYGDHVTQIIQLNSLIINFKETLIEVSPKWTCHQLVVDERYPIYREISLVDELYPIPVPKGGRTAQQKVVPRPARPAPPKPPVEEVSKPKHYIIDPTQLLKQKALLKSSISPPLT
jgi:hypothetical protein